MCGASTAQVLCMNESRYERKEKTNFMCKAILKKQPIKKYENGVIKIPVHRALMFLHVLRLCRGCLAQVDKDRNMQPGIQSQSVKNIISKS